MKRGFSLIEVVVALAMLALIAVPAIGLATMVAQRNQKIMTTGSASELKRRIDAAIRADASNVFSWPISSTVNSKVFHASEDLRYIVDSSTALPDEVDVFYTVNVRSPIGYTYNDSPDSYRIVMYEVLWLPNGAKDKAQLYFTSVFRK